MTTWLPRRIALLWLVLPFVPVVAVALDDTDVERLVKQLGHDDFARREEATKRLKEIGEPALDVVLKAAASDDPEVRRRAADVVAAIEKKLCVELLRLTGHAGQVWNVGVSADGRRVLTSSFDRTLRLWDADTGTCLRVFTGHRERVLAAALSPDGQRILSGSGDKSVRLWDAMTGKELHNMTGHTDEVHDVAFGPEGKAISGSSDQTMRLWDLKTGKMAGVFTGHTGWVCHVAYSDRTGLAVTSCTDQSIRLWNLDTGKVVRPPLRYSGDYDMSIGFSSDSKRLLTVGFRAPLRIWDVETGKELKQIENVNTWYAAFSPDGQRIVTGGCLDNIVRVWDAATGKELRHYEGHTDAVTRVAFFPDGKRIISASRDGTARIWRAPR